MNARILELFSSILPVDERKGAKRMGQMDRGQGIWEDNEQMKMEQKGVEGSEAKRKERGDEIKGKGAKHKGQEARTKGQGARG